MCRVTGLVVAVNRASAYGRPAAVLMIFGIGLYSAITATFTSFLITGDRTGDIASQLERLAVLRGDGRLTDAEFEVARAEVLGTRNRPAATTG